MYNEEYHTMFIFICSSNENSIWNNKEKRYEKRVCIYKRLLKQILELEIVAPLPTSNRFLQIFNE